MKIGHVPDEASPLVQIVRGSERASGVHAIILRQPVSERPVLDKLGLATDQEGEWRPGVYVQISRPGEPFVSFRLAQRKFYLPLWFYLELLDFFAPGGQYKQISEKARREAANLKLLREPVSLGVVTGFYHHGKIRYLLPFKNSREQQTIYVWIIADSKSPEGTEPECWTSVSGEKPEHQLATGPFQELAKHARAELSPWIKDKEAVAGPPAPVRQSSASAVAAVAAVATEEGQVREQADAPVDGGSALDTLERVCMEVARQLANPQQQPQPKQQPQSKKQTQPKQTTPSANSGASGADKKRSHYVSSSSTASSAASSRSSSVSRQPPPAQQRPPQGYYTNDRYKDQSDSKRSRQ
jgi:hypothetical protein